MFSDTKYVDLFVPLLNKIQLKPNENLFDSNYNPTFECVPRSKLIKGDISTSFGFLPKNDGWKVQNSFFFRQEYLEKFEKNFLFSGQCFEFDWEKSNLGSVVREKEGKSDLKILLKKIYSNIIDTYMFFLSQRCENGIFIFDKTSLLDFLSQSGLNNNKVLSNEEINHVIDSLLNTNSDDDFTLENSNHSSKFSLRRFQFLEFLVKIVHLKCTKKFRGYNYSDSFKLTLEGGLFAFLSSFSSDQWRNDKLWREECEKVLQYYYVFINDIFKKYAVSNFFKNQSYLTHSEFLELFEHLMLERKWEVVDQKDIDFAFLLSISKQLDDSSERAFIMNFMEFFEGLARVADILSPNPLQEKVKIYDFPYNCDFRRKNTLL